MSQHGREPGETSWKAVSASEAAPTAAPFTTLRRSMAEVARSLVPLASRPPAQW